MRYGGLSASTHAVVVAAIKRSVIAVELPWPGDQHGRLSGLYARQWADRTGTGYQLRE
jgi:hypothetical protein